jgi:hypothetical protein
MNGEGGIPIGPQLAQTAQFTTRAPSPIWDFSSGS